jgi:type IV secretory pathway TraG/TraD family ATPase VirD4
VFSKLGQQLTGFKFFSIKTVCTISQPIIFVKGVFCLTIKPIRDLAGGVFEGGRLYDEVQPPPCHSPVLCRLTSPSGQQIQLDSDIFSKHMCFIGGIGTGKSNAIFQVVQQLRASLSQDDVMILFDTKGDFHEQFYQNGDIVIANDDCLAGAADNWNIFSEIDTSSESKTRETINEIAETLFYEKIHGSKEPFFPNAAKDLLAAIMLHFSRSDHLPCNNEALKTYLDGTPIEMLAEMLTIYDDLRAMESYIKNGNQASGVFSELQQMSRRTFLGNFARSGGLSMREIVHQKGGKVVFVEYDIGIANMLTPIYRLLFDMAIKESLSRRRSKGNVWFVIDEFRLLPHLQYLENAVNFGRSLGVKFLIGVQNVSQIDEAYSGLAASILSGFSSNFVFRLNDKASKEYVQGIFDKNRKAEIYKSGSSQVIESIRDGHVVEDWDISHLNLGESIVGLAGCEPFRFQFGRFDG